MNTLVSAPEVFKFGGEYSVLDGGTGIAAAGDKTATASVREMSADELVIRLIDLRGPDGATVEQSFGQTRLGDLHQSFVRNKCLDKKEGKDGIAVFKQENGDIRPEVLPFAMIAAWLTIEDRIKVIGNVVTIHSEIPRGSGCASSSACSVAFTVGLVKNYGQSALGDKEIINAARMGDRIQHGGPTAGGMDVSASYFGGCISFNIADDVGKEVPAKIPEDVSIILINTGPKSGTGAFVPTVVSKMKDLTVSKALRDIAEEANCTLVALERGEMELLGECMIATNLRLERLGIVTNLDIVTENMKKAERIARHSGALGFKLSGSGGGGWAVAVTKQPKVLIEALDKEGFKDTREVRISDRGAKWYLKDRSKSTV